MNALIIDDERHARDELIRLLAAFPEVAIAGEARNAKEARTMIASHKPDLIFLDVQMPEETGLELLESLSGSPGLPKVIFTTAYDSYAIRAFDFGAVDYLQKPITPRRLEAAIKRLSIAPDAAADSETETDYPSQENTKPLGVKDKVLVGTADNIIYVAVENIIGAESIGAYSKIWLAGSSPIIKRSLSSIELRLPSEHFFRANRSELINLRHVASINTWFSGTLKVTMVGGRTVELSRRQTKLFRERNTL